VAVAQAAPPRPRAAGGRLFIIIGALLALVGFGAAILLGSLGGAKTGGGGSGCPCSLAVFAAKDIPFRNQIVDQSQVKIVSTPNSVMGNSSDWITIDSGTSAAKQQSAGLAAVQNFVAEVNIKAGSPLLRSVLAKQSGDIVSGLQAAYLPIPTGFVAFTMPTSEQVGVAGFIQPGDYINVIATLGSAKTAATVTVFPDLKVLRVGSNQATVSGAGSTQPQSSQSTGGIASSLTVVVTPCQAEYLLWFRNNAALTYELESYQDYNTASSRTTKTTDCGAGLGAANGVQGSDILAKFPQFQKALGG
jgi:Flp pilus assembly protein CpaB